MDLTVITSRIILKFRQDLIKNPIGISLALKSIMDNHDKSVEDSIWNDCSPVKRNPPNYLTMTPAKESLSLDYERILLDDV